MPRRRTASTATANNDSSNDAVREILAVSYGVDGGGSDDDDDDDDDEDDAAIDYDDDDDGYRDDGVRTTIVPAAAAASYSNRGSAIRNKRDSVRRRLFLHHPQDDHEMQQQSLPSSLHHVTLPTHSSSSSSIIIPTINNKTTFSAYNKNHGKIFLLFSTVDRRRGTVIASFVLLGLLYILGVHLYLFQAVVMNNRHNDNDNQHPPNEKSESGGSSLPSTSIEDLKPIVLPARELTPLRPIDYEKYTIRINTWRRNDQLLASVAHHASCQGVAQIQIVWCDSENEPPSELHEYDDGLIVVERHTVNNLNERFHILPSTTTPTLGILSIDDDVLRPCEAIDDGFFKWVKSPHRMVGFDARTHVVIESIDNGGPDVEAAKNKDGDSNNKNSNQNSQKAPSTTSSSSSSSSSRWIYGYLSTTEKTNRYSFSLTRYCFIHRDYMDQYMNDLPTYILDTVARNFNCEDVAMSFLISARTDGQPSLLADLWAMKSLVKLYVPERISGTSQHKALRDDCVDHFSTILGLKGGHDGDNKNHDPHALQTAKFVHSKDSFFECGAREDSLKDESYPKSQREIELEEMIQSWRRTMTIREVHDHVKKRMSKIVYTAYEMGLIANTDKWKEKFHKD